MRNFSNNVKTILALDEVAIFYLVRIVTPNVTLLDTTANVNITISGIGTFVPNNGLSTVEAPKLSSTVDRETYKLVYIDPDFSKRALFESVLTGSSVTVWVGFYNTTGGVIGTYQPGDIMSSVSDLVVAYKGIVDTQGYAIDPDSGTVVAAIECASPMASLGLVRPILTSRDALRQRNANDTAFDQVFQKSGQVFILWGKKDA